MPSNPASQRTRAPTIQRPPNPHASPTPHLADPTPQRFTVTKRSTPPEGKKSYESISQLCQSLFESDANVLGWFHYYNPFPFTKFTPGSGKPNARHTWGDAKDEALVRHHFDEVKAWSDANGVPVLLGEFGANGTCEQASREKYHSFIARGELKASPPYSAHPPTATLTASFSPPPPSLSVVLSAPPLPTSRVPLHQSLLQLPSAAGSPSQCGATASARMW